MHLSSRKQQAQTLAIVSEYTYDIAVQASGRGHGVPSMHSSPPEGGSQLATAASHSWTGRRAATYSFDPDAATAGATTATATKACQPPA